jgi:hypothetical protein
VEKRFWAKVDRRSDSECWLWLGALRSGYGHVTITRDDGRRSWYAHRVAYEMAHGEIPAGMTIDHLCRNLRCVNPDHLEVVTRKENVLRGVGLSARNARKTECKRGHPFTPENTYVQPSNSSRRCRTCLRAYANARYRARMAA